MVRCVLEIIMKFRLGLDTHFSLGFSGAPAKSGYKKYDGCFWKQTYWYIPVLLVKTKELKGN